MTDSSNASTGYTFNSAGMTSLTAYQAGGGGQTTAYLFGVTTATGSTINSNDIVGVTEYPDPTTGAASSSQKEITTVNALGTTLTYTDRNGTTHALGYDVLGREVSDAITTPGGASEGFFLFYDVAKKKTLCQEKLLMHVHDFAISDPVDLITCVGHKRITTHRLG